LLHKGSLCEKEPRCRPTSGTLARERSGDGAALFRWRNTLIMAKSKKSSSSLSPAYQSHPGHDDYIQALKRFGYEFRMNMLDNSVEVNNERITDALASKIRDQMRDHIPSFRRYLEAMEDAYTAEAMDNPYHPVKDYLFALKYDGGNYITQLTAYFKDKHGMFPTYLRRWLIGAVAKVYSGAQNMMLVLEGPQNIGKSYFCRWLCPVPTMYIDAAINPDDKDSDISLITRWIWEVSEVGATTRRADREALKAFITREVVTVRRPYGRFAMVKPALASFLATFNDEFGILADSTGSRRFNICPLTEIDWNYAIDVDVNSVWAEALAAYQAGEPWHLTQAEACKRDEINQEFTLVDPIEDLLKKCYTLSGNVTDWISTTEILSTLSNAGLNGGHSRANAMALAGTMKRLKIVKRSFNAIKGYEGLK